MFEGSLVESCGLVASKTQKWSALGSIALQCAVAAGLVAIPMLRPEVLQTSVAPASISVPNVRPVEMVQHVTQAVAEATAALSVPTPHTEIEQTHGRIVSDPTISGHGEPDGIVTMMPMDEGNAIAAIAVSVPAPEIVPRVHDTGPKRVSSGVSNGLLLSPITPAYPPIAKVAGVQGAVVIEAIISKAGRVESLNVVSGPEMLRNAAMDAVRAARYAPYRLNGEPIEVQTVITVVFRLGA